MAHAHAEVTGGLGVALVTAGPGVTNAMTGIANAFVSRAPVLVLSGTPPRLQENRGALQDIVHTDLVRTITRYARTVRQAALVPKELDAAVEHAFGHGREPGPVYLDFPTDTLREEVPQALQLDEYFHPRQRPAQPADPRGVSAAVELLWSARKPLVISGRGARGTGRQLVRLLDALGAVYLDTGESRGLVPDGHPSVVSAMRGTVMGDADLVVTIGRRLDFQLAYGSPAVYGSAKFVRISDTPSELPTIVAARSSCSPIPRRHWLPSSSQRPGVSLPSIASGRSGCAPGTSSAWPSCSRRWPQRRRARTAACIPTSCWPQSSASLTRTAS